MSREHRFTLRTTKEELERWGRFGKANGVTSVAKLLREGVRVLEQNPHFLNPTTNPYLQAIENSFQELNQDSNNFKLYVDSLDKKISTLETNINNISNILEKFVSTGKPLTKQELKEAKREDTSEEAIFD